MILTRFNLYFCLTQYIFCVVWMRRGGAQSYPAVTDFLKSGLYRWAGDAKMFDGDTYVELVCSPSNPDGGIREAVLKSGDGVAVHDLAYYWPQYTPITSAAAHDIMLFTVSKCTGHAGTRLGYVHINFIVRILLKFEQILAEFDGVF